MQTRVYNLNQCIDLYNTMSSLSNAAIIGMYTRLWQEYKINKNLTYKMSIVKYEYFIYLDNVFLPYITYIRNILISRNVDVLPIEEELKVKYE